MDQSLKYSTGMVAELLKSVKREFGTEGDLLKEWQNVLGAWADGSKDLQVKFA